MFCLSRNSSVNIHDDFVTSSNYLNTFIKIYKEKKLDGVYVIKKDLLNKKLLIIDSLTKKNFTMPVVLKLNTRYNYSVSFWEGNKILKFYKRFLFTVFETKKINIIYFNKVDLSHLSFFEELNLGYSDNF